MKLKLNQLDILLEVAAQGSIGKAAKALNLTQPAISKTIHEMEAEIGMPILQRSSRGVTLNEYGQVLLRHARDIDRSLHQARDEIDHLLGKAMRQLRVGFTSAASYGPFTQTLLQYQARFPGVKLVAMEGRPQQIHDALQNQRLDIAVITAATSIMQSGMYYEPLYALSNTIIAGKQHPITHITSLKNLMNYCWLDWDEPGEHSILAQVFRRYNLPQPQHMVHCSSPWIMARMMEQEDMVSMWTSVRLRFPDYNVNLRSLALREVLPATSIGILCQNAGRLSTAGQSFMEMLRINARDWLLESDAAEMVVRV